MPALIPRSAPGWLVDRPVDLLNRLGVTPNMLTLAGVLGAAGAGVLAGFGLFIPAGIVVLIAGSLDMFDGALARATGRATDFGSVFDAVMDRVSEAAILLGLLVYFSGGDHRMEQLLIFVAMAGSILVSYVRARAEIIGLRLKEGIFTRAERVLLLGAGLVLHGIVTMNIVTPVLWILAVLATATAFQRLGLVWLRTRESERE